MPPNSSGGPTPKIATSGAKRQQGGGVTTQSTSSKQETQTQSTTVNSGEEVKGWMNANRYLDRVNDKVRLDTLKNILLQLLRRPDTPIQVRNSMRAVAFGMEDIKLREAEKEMAEAMGKAAKEYREVLENLVETLMKSLKGMANHAKETLERMGDSQTGAEVRMDQGGGVAEGGGGRQEAWATAGEGVSYVEVARRVEREDMAQRARFRAKQIIIDNRQGGEGWRGLTELELIEKAKITKDMMGI
ncbi:hypothetical protein C0992_013078 [Termitomyces sp. T32_za158]|nr:hypothetical protein C0992_013078 [Termitomyces sp. T32_za158]